jgi:hypothetical protein
VNAVNEDEDEDEDAENERKSDIKNSFS